MSKSNLLIPFGLVNGVMKFVDDVPNGKESGAICASCSHPLIARNGGSRRAHHFAHAHQTACENGVETAIHKMAKQVLLDHKEINLPEARKSVELEIQYGRMLKREPVVISEQIFVADKAREEVFEGRIRPDVILSKGEHKLRIEVAVTHFVDDIKETKVIEKNIPMLEIDLSNFYQQPPKSEDEFIDAVINDSSNKSWIHNPKLEALYQQGITTLKFEREQIIKNQEFKKQKQQVVIRKKEEQRKSYLAHIVQKEKAFNSQFANEIEEFNRYRKDPMWIEDREHLAMRDTGLISAAWESHTYKQFQVFSTQNKKEDLIFNAYPTIWQYYIIEELFTHRKEYTLYSLTKKILSLYGIQNWAMKLYTENQHYKKKGRERKQTYQSYGMYFMDKSFCCAIPSPYSTVKRYLEKLSLSGLLSFTFKGPIQCNVTPLIEHDHELSIQKEKRLLESKKDQLRTISSEAVRRLEQESEIKFQRTQLSNRNALLWSADRRCINLYGEIGRRCNRCKIQSHRKDGALCPFCNSSNFTEITNTNLYEKGCYMYRSFMFGDNSLVSVPELNNLLLLEKELSQLPNLI